MTKPRLTVSASVLAALVSLGLPSAAWADAQANQLQQIQLPERIPAQCVVNAASRYNVPGIALLSILKQESGGRVGVTNKNTNGTIDYGPAQLNSSSWGRIMTQKFGISTHSLTNNMCQALMAQAYVLRSEWDTCRKDGNQSIWCAIGHYHSRTPKYRDKYIASVWKKYQSILARGAF